MFHFLRDLRALAPFYIIRYNNQLKAPLASQLNNDSHKCDGCKLIKRRAHTQHSRLDSGLNNRLIEAITMSAIIILLLIVFTVNDNKMVGSQVRTTTIELGLSFATPASSDSLLSLSLFDGTRYPLESATFTCLLPLTCAHAHN